MKKDQENFIKIFSNRSELVHADGRVEHFEEGTPELVAAERYKRISKALEEGFLENLITSLENGEIAAPIPDPALGKLIDQLVSSLTSEFGRALIGLSVLQLAVKAIEPDQSIRLHKAGRMESSFSWKQGISMRSLDSKFITPTLRSHNLLKLNADGFMMTRSLAENYPYSPFYKASLRGARQEWLGIVEAIENGSLVPLEGLKYLIQSLISASKSFEQLSEETIASLQKYVDRESPISRTVLEALLTKHREESGYAARLMEISMHGVLQAAKDCNAYEGVELVPLSQMRSANKKHGNIGDVEFKEGGNIIVAWDAKYGKPYLREELEELSDKLSGHPSIQTVGFVTNTSPERLEELRERITDMYNIYGVEVQILEFSEWLDVQFQVLEDEGVSEGDFAKAILIAYTETLALRRLDRAPIDEPGGVWLSELSALLRDA